MKVWPAAALAALVVLVAGAPAGAAAGFAYLDASQVAQLRTLPIPVVLPSALPPGFLLRHFKAKRYPMAGGGAGAAYELDFKNRAGADIIVFGGDAGFGDPPGDSDAARAPFAADAPAVGTMHFAPLKDRFGRYWMSQRVRIDRPQRAHPVAFTVEGSAPPAALRVLCRALVRLAK